MGHKEVSPKLRVLYESGSPSPTPVPQVLARRLGVCQEKPDEAFGTQWTGPYVILLTTLTALKVHSIATWVHYSHARPADPFTLKEDYQGNGWETSRDPRNHPLQLCVIRQWQSSAP